MEQQKKIFMFDSLINKHKLLFSQKVICPFCNELHKEWTYFPFDVSMIGKYDVWYNEKPFKSFSISNSCGYYETRTIVEMKQDISRRYYNGNK